MKLKRKYTKRVQKRNKTKKRIWKGGDYNTKIVGKRDGVLIFDKETPVMSYYPGGHIYPFEKIDQ